MIPNDPSMLSDEVLSTTQPGRSMIRRLARLGLALVLGVFGYEIIARLGSATPPLQEFKSEVGGFSVRVPTALKEVTQTVESPTAGPIDAHVFSGAYGSVNYGIVYSDMPTEVISKSDPEQILDGSRNGAVSNVNGKLVLETKVHLEAYPGRQLVVDVRTSDGRDRTVMLRIFLVGSRLYQVLVMAPKGVVSSDEMTTFLDSFKLIPK